MGNENCSAIQTYKYQNQSYGDFTPVKQNNKTLALIDKILENDKQLINEVKQKLQLRLKLKSKHLVKLQTYHIDFNNYSYHIKLYYELITKTLRDKYDEKIQQQSQFTERELFSIIYGVQEALQELKSHDIVHGCINLSTILCQNNFYKITDVSSTTFVKSYELVRMGNFDQFLSPKLLTNLQYRSLEPYYEIEDDLFSLGMIILTLVCGYKTEFYVWNPKKCTGQIRWENVQNGIKKIQRSYSSKLSRHVKQLIGFGQQTDKSMETNSTTANNNNLTKCNNLGEITQSINELDKDIDRILSRVQIFDFNHQQFTGKKVPQQSVNYEDLNQALRMDQKLPNQFNTLKFNYPSIKQLQLENKKFQEKQKQTFQH